ncbi:MAG: hypothetical protein ABSH56_15885 [Bryobacteraceae bacterium]|jgi:hypothetical protein
MTANPCPLIWPIFSRLQSSPGVIIVSQDLDIGTAIDDLLLIWAATAAADWVDQLGYLPI